MELELIDLEDNDINLQCLFENYLNKMNSLTKLMFNYDGESLDGESISGIANMIDYFGDLSVVELSL